MRKEPTKKIKEDVSAELRRMAATATKLTPKLIRQFCVLVKAGHGAAAICGYLGISDSAFHAWVRKGKEYLDASEPNPKYLVYGAFVNQYQKACSEYIFKQEEELHDSVDKNWYRHVVILERKDRKNWGKHEPPGGNETDVQTDERFL